MRPRLSLRWLRIAFSVTCGLACLLLIVLWVRSYWRFDGIHRLYRNGMTLSVASNNGAVLVPRRDRTTWLLGQTPTGWKLRSGEAVGGLPHFQWMLTDGYPYFAIPDWFPVLIAATLAAAPWLRWRFSLRTLLIATTLIALLLGLVVYASR